ncbi:fructosamine kinase [Knoellia sinensis KCTC 19936]|uniref:Fructosamine kinase n=1 Tax=Knoellia sinensis KCTC 19936 TaxID=1385520 RepID=A0A0A0J1M8_9MICO|nr:fructosamine kinase family protein [Knoellia sinensis]KGN31330.1 fructosamine kinase [Knoellia sinensis KCTC 19936]
MRDERKTWIKSVRGGPSRYAEWEACGLRWLGEGSAAGGARVVEVLDSDSDGLVLERLVPVAPTVEAAEEFGSALAATHSAGAPAWGAPPEGWDGPGWFGPADRPLPLELGAWSSWGEMYAVRLASLTRLARDGGELTADEARDVDALGARCAAGEFDTGEAPSRIHGDLWSGNLMWTADGVVLIDPAAHGGHREADLAMLDLFGAPHLERIHTAYDEVRPLQDGWRDRVGLHQLYPVLVHAVLFGGGYARQAMGIVARL